MLIWIIIAIIFIWLIILTAWVVGTNIVLNDQGDVLQILRDDINELRFGKND